MKFKISLREFVYFIGVVLITILFGFGSYVDDLHTDSILTKFFKPFTNNVLGGVVPSDIEHSSEIQTYFEKIKAIETPEIFVVIAETDKTSDVGPIVTNTDIFTQADQVFLRKDSGIFNVPDDITKITPFIQKAFPEAEIVPILITPNSDPRHFYQLAKLLKQEIPLTKKRVFVLGLSNSSEAPNNFVKELHNATFERVLINLDIPLVDKLEIESQKPIKTLLYYLNFLDGQNSKITYYGNNIFAYYTKPEADKEPVSMQRITLLGFGDIMLDRSVRKLMDANTLYYPFEKITDPSLKFMRGTDFVFANHEGPIHEIYTPTSKSIAFRFKPDVVEVLKNVGITIVSVANNHALDQGWGGRDDTMKFLKLGGIMFFGNPKNIVGGEGRDSNEKVLKISDSKVAFIGFDDTIFKIDNTDVGDYIKGLKEKNDFVIVSVHWGIEYKHTPNARQIELAHMFIDSGADIVLGHHPHVIQTMEVYNGKPIFYSMGNFVFDQYFSVDTQEGLAVGVVLEKQRKVLYLFPYSIPKSQPTLMNDEEKTKFFEKFISWGKYDEALINQIKAGKIVIEN